MYLEIIKIQSLKENGYDELVMYIFCFCYMNLYNNQINARALIGQSAVGYCYYKPTEISRVF